MRSAQGPRHLHVDCAWGQGGGSAFQRLHSVNCEWEKVLIEFLLCRAGCLCDRTRDVEILHTKVFYHTLDETIDVRVLQGGNLDHRVLTKSGCDWAVPAE